MDDSDSVTQVLAGNKEAYAALVRRYHRRLYYFVVGKVSDSSEAEDIVQKTFVTAFFSLMAYDLSQPLFKWLCGIALNHCRALWRTLDRQARLNHRLLQARRAELELAHLERSETADDPRLVALRQCLQGLKQHEQKAIHLRFVEELPLQAVGKQLGKTSEAARLFLFRIRRNLADCVKSRLESSDW
jgi:RNA polymerase sigma-70 factor (ECF subfamily)